MPAVLVSPNKGRQTRSQYGSLSRRRSRSPHQLIGKWQWMDRKDIIKSFSSIFTNHSSNTGMPRRACTDTSIVRKLKLTHQTRPSLFDPISSLRLANHLEMRHASRSGNLVRHTHMLSSPTLSRFQHTMARHASRLFGETRKRKLT